MKKKENDEIRITPDALISLVVTEAEERELASMPSLKEMNAQFHPSEQFQDKMDRLLKKARRKEGWGQIWKPTKKVLIAFASVMTALTVAFLPVKAVQDAVVDTLIQWKDGFINIIYSEEDGYSRYPDLQKQVELNYIPEKYTLLSENNSTNDRYIAEYSSKSGDWFTVLIDEISANQELGVDNDFTEYYALEFDNHRAIWGIREDINNTLIWEDRGLAFTIYGSPDISELLKIAEGIEIVPSSENSIAH